MIKPLNTNVLLKKIEKDNKTKSGIILTTKKEKEDNQGLVISVGCDVKDLKTNDIVIFENYKATSFKYSDEEYMLIQDKDILAKLDK